MRECCPIGASPLLCCTRLPSPTHGTWLARAAPAPSCYPPPPTPRPRAQQVAPVLQLSTSAVRLDPCRPLTPHIPTRSISLLPSSEYNQNSSPLPASLAAIPADPCPLSPRLLPGRASTRGSSSIVCPQQSSRGARKRKSSQATCCSGSFSGSHFMQNKTQIPTGA